MTNKCRQPVFLSYSVFISFTTIIPDALILSTLKMVIRFMDIFDYRTISAAIAQTLHCTALHVLHCTALRLIRPIIGLIPVQTLKTCACMKVGVTVGIAYAYLVNTTAHT